MSLAEESMHKVARAIVKALNRKVHSRALDAKFLRLQLETFLYDVVREVPDLLALVIEAQGENARLVNKDDVYKWIRNVVNGNDTLLEADHLGNIELLKYVSFVKNCDLEHFVLDVRNGIEVTYAILLYTFCFDVVTREG